ncbi:MAG: hypothetical protein AAGK05_18295, partial [Pseudomonadota bacterium]
MINVVNNRAQADLISSPGEQNVLESRPCVFFYANCRSLVPKFHHLTQYIAIHNPKIICLTETWLDSSIPSSFITPANFQCFRFDRPYSKGGGVVIFVSNELSTCGIDFPTCLPVEHVAARVMFSKDVALDILCVYRPPNLSSYDDSSLHGLLN